MPCLLAALSPLLAPAARGAAGDGMRWLPGSFTDYAPAGMPDFSQCRADWSQPGSPGQWTYAGPVTLASPLWWLDSAAEPAPQPPDRANDGHGLVTSYPVFGPPVDDHSPANVFPLVEDLAGRAGTDGRGRQATTRGTAWEDLVAATDTYVKSRRLGQSYRLEVAVAPGPAWLAERAGEGAGTVVLLGVWEDQAGAWRRVGGHYAAVAGFDAGSNELALADPLADAAALGGAGRSVPPGPAGHSCREAPRAHDDAAVVAHDVYPLRATGTLPDGRYSLIGYFQPATQHEAAAFQGQNPSAALKPWSAAWQRGPVVMALDAALALVPVMAHPATATATETATETATPVPTASPLPPRDTATATRVGPTATMPGAQPATVGPPRGLLRLWLPWCQRPRP